jgi:hypothetical protein
LHWVVLTKIISRISGVDSHPNRLIADELENQAQSLAIAEEVCPRGRPIFFCE